MYDEYDMDDLLPSKKNKSKHDLLDQLKFIEDDTDYSYLDSEEASVKSKKEDNSTFLPSNFMETSHKKKKEKDYDPDSWFNEIMSLQSGKISKKTVKGGSDLYEAVLGKKKKKKKKNKDDKTIDYKKEFEPEMALYKNLLVEQNKFTDSLQKEYDMIRSSKGSARGVNKQISDLIANITEARDLSMRLVEKNINAKKTIAELSMKQNKELGLLNGEGENMSDFASTYMKQLLMNRNDLLNGASNNVNVAEYNDDDLFSELNLSLTSGDDYEERPEEVEKYLQYENQDVKVYVKIQDNDYENYEFVAKDADGNIIEDYPKPIHTSISVNQSTGIATDAYGKKYFIIQE